MRKLAFIVSFLLTVSYINQTYGQSQGYKIKVYGFVKHEGKPLKGAEVVIYGDHGVVDEQRVDDRGRFETVLNLDAVYTLSFDKDGYVSKMMLIDVLNIPDDYAQYGFEDGGWTIEMLKRYDDIDYSILDKPIARIYFAEDEGQMATDIDFIKLVRKDLDDLTEEVEKLEANIAETKEKADDEYNTAVVNAKKALSRENYDRAIEFYNQANLVKPNEQLPKDEIQRIEQLKLANATKEEQYNKLIIAARQEEAASQLNAAILKYEEALALKPKSVSTRDKIAELKEIAKQQENAAVAAQKAEEKAANDKQAQVEREYKEAISSAGDWYEMKQYAAAKEKYQLALSLKPGSLIPEQKLKEIEVILEKQNQERIAEEARLREIRLKDEQYNNALLKADRYMESKNYEQAKIAYDEALAIKPNEIIPKQKINQIKRLIEQQKAQEATAVKQAEKEVAKKESDHKLYANIVSLGDNNFSQQNWAMALKHYERALAINPNDLHVKEQMGLAEQRIEADKKAEQKRLAAKEKAREEALKNIDLENEPAKYDQKFLDELAKQFPEGVTEKKYKVGNKMVTKRIVIKEGKGNVYRMVKTNYGAIYYFKNSDPITKFIWEKESVL